MTGLKWKIAIAVLILSAFIISVSLLRKTSENRNVTSVTSLQPRRSIGIVKYECISDMGAPSIDESGLKPLKHAMILVPGGEFIMGESGDENLPRKKVNLKAFYMDKYPVTQAQFQRFRKKTGYERDSSVPGKSEFIPVTGLTRNDAEAYARWVGKRLPTEAEWEKACRGTDGRKYPWGNQWDDSACYRKARKPMPAGQNPGGASPYGLEDMVGNVFHITCTDDTRKDGYTIFSVVKGGGWSEIHEWNTCYFRAKSNPKDPAFLTGFRCVKPLHPGRDLNYEKGRYAELSRGDNMKYINHRESTRQVMLGNIAPTRSFSEFFMKHTAKLPEGAVVADIGTGVGFLAFYLAQAVGPEGRVYAVDIDGEVLEFISRVARNDNLTNIITVKSRDLDICLPDNSCDAVFAYSTIKFMRDEKELKQFLGSFDRALKNGGRILIGDSDNKEIVNKSFVMLKKMGYEEDKTVLSDTPGIFYRAYIKRTKPVERDSGHK